MSNPVNDNPNEAIRLSEQRLKEIEDDIKQTPLTSDLQALSELLRSQYQHGENNQNFLAGITALEQDYSQIRIVRGDGNCYYRAFLYSLAEKLLLGSSNNNNDDKMKAEGQRILQFVKKESFECVKKVYEEMTISVFFEEFVELLEKVISKSMTLADLHSELNQENATSDYCTWYCRVLTATHLRQDPERFLPFLSQPGLDIVQFCQREVEPMGKECEQVQVLALAEAFGVQVQIEYLDGHDLTINGKLTNHVFGPEEATLKLNMLYRPGHYDILYPKTK